MGCSPGRCSESDRNPPSRVRDRLAMALRPGLALSLWPTPGPFLLASDLDLDRGPARKNKDGAQDLSSNRWSGRWCRRENRPVPADVVVPILTPTGDLACLLTVVVHCPIGNCSLMTFSAHSIGAGPAVVTLRRPGIGASLKM